ncbi:MAG: cell surface protein [Gemmatimonadota bacterium]|nr:MAG: cell surface protein [Gemmatimonadota bacterium]
MATHASLQSRLDAAVDVLNKFGIIPTEDEVSQMADLLDDIVEVDPPKVTAMARVMQYMGSFNELVRDEIRDVKVGERYNKIADLFDSVVTDARILIDQLDDNRIDLKERIRNSWMKLVRGGIPRRFEKIKSTYNDVGRDTNAHLGRENRVLSAYAEFRGAVKEAESLAYEVATGQEKNLAHARQASESSENELKSYKGSDPARKAELQLARDEAYQALVREERRLRLVSDIAEHLKMGYSVGETVMARLQQSHDAKEQVHNRSVAFFGTNEHVFTALAATYTSQLGLHEATQTLDAMAEGVNRSLETLAEVGGKLQEEALKAAHGPTIRAEALQKLVDAVVEYQTTSRQKIRELRDANKRNAEEIERIVEEGKERARETALTYQAA